MRDHCLRLRLIDPCTCTAPLDILHTICGSRPVAMRTYSRQMKGNLRSSRRILFIFVALHSLGYAVDLGRESPSAIEGVIHVHMLWWPRWWPHHRQLRAYIGMHDVLKCIFRWLYLHVVEGFTCPVPSGCGKRLLDVSRYSVRVLIGLLLDVKGYLVSRCVSRCTEIK